MQRFCSILAIASVLFALFLAGGVSAESQPSALGFWDGSIEYPGSALGFNVVLLQDRDGDWAGVIGIPTQGIWNLRLNKLEVAGQNVVFGMEGINGNPLFTGTLSADGQAIAGTLAQGGQAFAFVLRRTSEPPPDGSELLAPYEKAGVAGEGLAGTWLGLLEMKPARIRLVMTISEGADGVLSGTMKSPDQNDKEVPIDSLSVDGKAVNLSLGSIYATYQAELNDDGSELYGSWDQTGHTMTLHFKRQGDSGQ
jgi:hypothetical protein